MKEIQAEVDELKDRIAHLESVVLTNSITVPAYLHQQVPARKELPKYTVTCNTNEST
jgi:hypothetical protein